jgi:hypothetical protein
LSSAARELRCRTPWWAFGVALLLAACAEVDETPPQPPKLAFAQTTFDFGCVAQGTPVEHRFTFSNQGGAALTIMDLRAACDGAATLPDGREFAPHAAGAVQARFDTNATFGPQRRTVTVYSNDPEQRAVLLTLTGEVLLDVAADPSQVYFGTVAPGLVSVREIAVRTGDETIHIGPPQTDAPQLTVQLSDGLDGAAAKLAIGTARDAPPGPFTATVRVPTTSAQHPMLRIAVAGIIADARAGGAPPAHVPDPVPVSDSRGATPARTDSGAP